MQGLGVYYVILFLEFNLAQYQFCFAQFKVPVVFFSLLFPTLSSLSALTISFTCSWSELFFSLAKRKQRLDIKKNRLYRLIVKKDWKSNLKNRWSFSRKRKTAEIIFNREPSIFEFIYPNSVLLVQKFAFSTFLLILHYFFVFNTNENQMLSKEIIIRFLNSSRFFSTQHFIKGNKPFLNCVLFDKVLTL